MFGSGFYMATLIYNGTEDENAKHKGLVQSENFCGFVFWVFVFVSFRVCFFQRSWKTFRRFFGFSKFYDILAEAPKVLLKRRGSPG